MAIIAELRIGADDNNVLGDTLCGWVQWLLAVIRGRDTCMMRRVEKAIFCTFPFSRLTSQESSKPPR